MKHHKHPPAAPKEKPAPAPVDLASESVAGEEDPGASLDLPSPAPRRDRPAAGRNVKPPRPR